MSAAPGPGNSITIYMNFMPTPIMTSNTAYTGEAPQLYGGAYAQGSYAQYDNGAKVFINYLDFKGASLPSGISSVVYNSGPSIVLNDGIELSCNFCGGIQYYYNTQISSPEVTETYEADISTNVGQGGEFYTGQGTGSPSCSYNDCYNGGFYGRFNSGENGQILSDGSSVSSSSVSLPNGMVQGFYWNSGLEQYFQNYSLVTSSTSGSPSFSSYYAGFGMLTTSNYISETVYWFRTRAYPPNGAMPSVSFGSPV
jgi:hypothetical protein